MKYRLEGFLHVGVPSPMERFARWRKTLRTKLRKIKHAIQTWWRCRAKKCDYFEHYLAYGPAELTHEGYHAACRRCDEVQKLDMKYMDEHPKALHSPYERQAAEWEKRVRA